MLGLVRAGIAGNRSSGGLLSASCNLQLSYAEDPSCHQYIALSTNRLRIEYDEHAERTYIAEIDEGPNTKALPSGPRLGPYKIMLAVLSI
jgi:hypothetical protein